MWRRPRHNGWPPPSRFWQVPSHNGGHGMMTAMSDLNAWQLVLLVIGGLIALGIVSALLTAGIVRLGLRTPWVIHRINRLRNRLVAIVKRPITIMVLDEVADVIQTGHYTRNISDALIENHDELKRLVAEKVRHDPSVKLIGRLPGYDAVVGEVTETTLRVLIAMLEDPRMDEVVSDLLRNNLQQIKRAVRARQHEKPPEIAPPDITQEELRRRRAGWRR